MDDLELSDILNDIRKPKREKKKKVDGKAKGDRTENHLCKLLTKRFGPDREFSRGVGSGNRWSQVNHMPQHAKDTFLGDICCPEGFRWVIECKGGYEEDINLNSFTSPIAKLDEWIEKAERDARLSGRLPIIMWKQNRKPWLAIAKLTSLFPDGAQPFFEYYLIYRGWIMVDLNLLLDWPDDWFFKERNES